MVETIIITGTPGTGKTTFAKKLSSELDYEYIDVNKVIEEKRLYEDYDAEMDTKIVDIDALTPALIEIIEEKKKGRKGIVIDSHLSHHLPKEAVDKCIVTKCNIKVLKKRLEDRGYSEKKVRENLDAEIFDVCRIEALEAGHIVETVITG